MADITFGTPTFQSNGIIELSLSINEGVRYLSPTSFQLAATAAPGDTTSDFNVTDVLRTLRGNGTDYILEIQIPDNRQGVLSVSGTGNITLVSSGVTESLSGMTTVNFSTIIPRITDWNLPNYTHRER